MIKQPLFGQDSSPHRTSSFLSAVITFVFWLIMTVAGVFIKIKPASPKYKEIQIVLSSTPVVDPAVPENAPAVPEALEGQTEIVAVTTQEEPPAIVEQPVVPESTPVVPEALEGPAKVETPPAQTKAEPTPAPAQTSKTTAPSTSSGTPKTTKASTPTPKVTDPAKKVNFDDYQYATDLSQGVDFNKTTTKKQDFDWSQFENSSEPEPQISPQEKTVTTQSTMQGAAGQTSANKNQAQTSKSNNSNNTSPAVSSETGKKLKDIKNTVVAKGSGNGIDTSITSDTANSDSKTLAMADGTTRRIIKSSPIEFSKEAADTIDFDSMTVKITFRVLTDGNVFPGSIKIDKEIFLDPLVVEQIKNQIKTWLLAPANSEAVAIFELTIKKN